MEEFQLLQQVLSQCREIKNELTELRQLTMFNKAMLTLNEFCRYSGLSKASAYKLTSTGKIKHYKPTGGVLLFKKSEVDDFLVSNPVLTIDVSEAKSSNYLITQSKKKKYYLNSKKTKQ
jgi:excisionase family DNA binding protein